MKVLRLLTSHAGDVQTPNFSRFAFFWLNDTSYSYKSVWRS